MPAPKRQQGTPISKHDEAIDDYIASLEAHIAELEAAISKHRRDTWGDGAVEHPHDAELYTVLER